MQLEDLNFKQVLVILTSKEMRLEILKLSDDFELDIGFKFVDSYLEAAKQISTEVHDPYDYLIFDTRIKNRKSKDFNEFIESYTEKNNNFLLPYHELKNLSSLQT
jgi:hypothetical protein